MIGLRGELFSLIFSLVLLLVLPVLVVSSDCSFEAQEEHGNHQLKATAHAALKYKLVAIGSILFSSGLGVCLPFVVKNVPSLHPDREPFFLVKAFAAGVILATGCIHILPDAFESLTSPCLPEKPWRRFPFPGLVAMLSAIGTLMMESFATGYHKRSELRKAQPVSGDEETQHLPHHRQHGDNNGGGHVHGSALAIWGKTESSDHIRHRIVSQVLELGIVVHSVIIGLSLGASQSSKTIRPLVAALSFHQFFEGIGLGGCIAQARFKPKAIAIMVLFFSLTTPTGIAVGIWISNSYNENSPGALIVQGVLNAASAGILVYMALVDLLAADFMTSKMLSNFRLQIGANFTLLLGACSMSLLALWGEH